MRAWMITKKALGEILETAGREALKHHPKQPRRRFDARNQAIHDGIQYRGEWAEYESFAQLTDVAGIVVSHKVNLGTKKWADYRTDYLDVTGKIERETDASVLIAGTWYRKSNLFAVIRDWDL